MPSIRVLLDNNVSIRLCRHLPDCEAIHASTLGWAAISNGDLIQAAREAEFAVMVTSDQNIRHQQNLTVHPLALVVLSTTHWATIRDSAAEIATAIGAAEPGSYITINLPRPPRIRRPYPPRLNC
jgi:predicted nuclease of predicted toxin-antitoxin system